ncbi:MAG: CRISPR system precrRNA processing endoribonuclease RAMP protein Cas6 [Sulfurimonas sp.]|nr:CRISPR system precrRNA processing endoribonuclease RAMP protein Cas6 [Sulfurimonas sp.]
MKYIKLSIIIKSATKPPYFIGSQLRGALGYALKKVTCINPSFECAKCFAKENCLYYEFYEQKNKQHKYRFDFNLGKDFYEFDFYLFEDVCMKLPYVVSAFHMMLTKNGLGKEKAIYKDFDMFINDKNCITGGELKLPKDFINTLKIDNFCPDAKVELQTPLRIKKDNRFVRDDKIELKDIVNSIYQRQMQLLDRGFKKFPYEIKGEVIKKELSYKELTRKSNRQKTTMNLGGIMGMLEIEGLNEETYNVLKLGELIACGKSTVFGLGKIKVEELNG